MCSVSTDGERASPALVSQWALHLKYSRFLKLDRPNPFGDNLGSLFHSYTRPVSTSRHSKNLDLVKVEYRLIRHGSNAVVRRLNVKQ